MRLRDALAFGVILCSLAVAVAWHAADARAAGQWGPIETGSLSGIPTTDLNPSHGDDWIQTRSDGSAAAIFNQAWVPIAANGQPGAPQAPAADTWSNPQLGVVDDGTARSVAFAIPDGGGVGNIVFRDLVPGNASTPVETLVAGQRPTCSISAAFNPDGSGAVAWTDQPNRGGPIAVRALQFTTQGVAVGQPVTLDPAVSTQGCPYVAMGANGSALVTWTAATQDIEAAEGIVLAKLSPAGIPSAPALVNNSPVGGNPLQPFSHPMIVGNPAGQAVIVWSEYRELPNSPGLRYSLHAVRVDPGGALGPDQTLTSLDEPSTGGINAYVDVGKPAVSADGTAYVPVDSDLNHQTSTTSYARYCQAAVAILPALPSTAPLVTATLEHDVDSASGLCTTSPNEVALTAVPGGALAAWLPLESPYVPMDTALVTAAGRITSQQTFSTPGASFPALSSAPNGDATLAWLEYPGPGGTQPILKTVQYGVGSPSPAPTPPAAAMPPAPPPSTPVAPPNPPSKSGCPGGLELIGIRGTTEKQNSYKGWGLNGNAFKSELVSRLGGLGAKAKQEGLQYPASPGTFNPIANDPRAWVFEYTASVSTGITALTKLLKSDTGGHCYVIAGYSQGAHIAGDVLASSQLSNSTRKRIIAVALLADPRFDSHDTTIERFGSFETSHGGFFSARKKGSMVPRGAGYKVLSACNKHDFWCQAWSDGVNFGDAIAVHNKYETCGTKLADIAAGLVDKRYGIAVPVPSTPRSGSCGAR